MKEKYEMIDLIKYICSILVIVIHTSPGLPYSRPLNFFLINIIGRIAVPFFFIANGYFMSKNLQQKGNVYFKQYIKSLIKIYLLWSLVYLPFGIIWIQENI
ncbi:MAG: acyltransferase, partial [Erysipelotrichaceae bacterium]|nr:acyltransferase [Erysipelotrichaceae bacterium]